MKAMNKVVKVLAASVLMTMMVGCASVGSVGNKMVDNKDKSGVIYGSAGYTDTTASEICKAISNKDSRCGNAYDYVNVAVFSKFGYADGAVGINALVRKDFPNLNNLKRKGTMTDSNAFFVKAQVIPGQLGELLDIVSTNGDGKCYWPGMPRAGGTVCPTYNWDYRKDNQAAIIFR